MASVNAAQLAGEADKLGSLQPGHLADLLVITPRLSPQAGNTRHDAWWALTHATASQVALVTVSGEPVYGDVAMLGRLPGSAVEKLSVCGVDKGGVDKGIVLRGTHGRADAADVPWVSTEAGLALEMALYGRRLAPLSECGN